MKVRAPKVMWDDDEWDKLASIVFIMRRNDPVPALTTLVDKALKQFPVERRRKLSTATIHPLLERLKVMSDELLMRADKADILEDRLETYEREKLSRQEVLNSISDEELMHRYGNRILLKLLDTYYSHRVTPALSLQKVVREQPIEYDYETVTPKLIPERKKRVVIVGPSGNQCNILQRKLPEYEVICFKELHDHPPTADLFIKWTDFVSHNVQGMPDDCVLFTGGLTRMVELVRERLPLQPTAE